MKFVSVVSLPDTTRTRSLHFAAMIALRTRGMGSPSASAISGMVQSHPRGLAYPWMR